MPFILNFDTILTKFLGTLIPHSPLFNSFFAFFSLKGSSILVWLLVIIIVVILEERKNPGFSKRDKKFIILFSLSFLITAFLSDIVFKNIFQRSRPFIAIYNHLQLFTTNFNCPIDFSFPSTHSATAFAAATVLTFFDKKRCWFYYIIAVVISYSRIYLGCHYFIDVVIGAVLGVAISKLLFRLIPKKWQLP